MTVFRARGSPRRAFDSSRRSVASSAPGSVGSSSRMVRYVWAGSPTGRRHSSSAARFHSAPRRAHESFSVSP